jgi:hypothetical protein
MAQKRLKWIDRRRWDKQEQWKNKQQEHEQGSSGSDREEKEGGLIYRERF